MKLATILALASMWIPPARAGDVERTFATAKAEVFAATAEKVESLAEWCGTVRLLPERHLLYEALLALDEENAAARRCRSCGSHARTRKGRAAPPEHYEEFLERHAKLQREWRRDLLALRNEFELEDEEIARLWCDLLILIPDDADARAYRGEVRAEDDSWVLQETRCAHRYRLESQRAIRELLAREDEQRIAVTEDGSPITWDVGLELRDGRLFGTCSRDEAHRIAFAVDSVSKLFRFVFRERPALPDDFAIYVLDRRSKRDFLARHPRVEDRDRVNASNASGVWIDGDSALAIWTPEAAGRDDTILRETIRRTLQESFGLDSQHDAWALAGFQARFEELILGGCQVDYAERNRPRTERFDCAWPHLLRLARTERLPSLASVTAADSPSLTREACLMAYGFARYLIECRPEDAAVILDDIGRSEIPLDECLRRVLGRDFQAVEARLFRWLEEMS